MDGEQAMASGQRERAMGERAVASCERAERSRGEQRREQTERGVWRGQGKTGAEGGPTPPLAADAADATGNGRERKALILSLIHI